MLQTAVSSASPAQSPSPGGPLMQRLRLVRSPPPQVAVQKSNSDHSVQNGQFWKQKWICIKNKLFYYKLSFERKQKKVIRAFFIYV